MRFCDFCIRCIQQGIHITLNSLILLGLAAGGAVFRKQGILLFGEGGQFCFHTLRGWQRNSTHPL